MPSTPKISSSSIRSSPPKRHSRASVRVLTRGFAASIAVMMIALGTAALSLAALGAAVSYSDQVFLEEGRIQKGLNKLACDDTSALIKAKDLFASGTIHLPEFDCDAVL